MCIRPQEVKRHHRKGREEKERTQRLQLASESSAFFHFLRDLCGAEETERTQRLRVASELLCVLSLPPRPLRYGFVRPSRRAVLPEPCGYFFFAAAIRSSSSSEITK